jgi:hypothetical protein
MHLFVRTAVITMVVSVTACRSGSETAKAVCSIELARESQPPDGRVKPVVIRVNHKLDTVPQVLSSLQPEISPDRRVHGIAMTEDGEATRGYSFDPCSKELTVFPLPADLNGYFHEIAISPDAHFVAYVAHERSGATRGVVRAWPQMETVFEASSAQGYPSDVESDHVEWSANNRFRILYRIQDGQYMAVSGDLRGPLKVDTLGTKPTQDSVASMSNTR